MNPNPAENQETTFTDPNNQSSNIPGQTPSNPTVNATPLNNSPQIIYPSAANQTPNTQPDTVQETTPGNSFPFNNQPTTVVAPSVNANQPAVSSQPVPPVSGSYNLQQPMNTPTNNIQDNNTGHHLFSVKRVLVSIAIILIIAAGAFTAYHYTKGSVSNLPSKSISVTVPANWKTFNSGFGFTVEGPSTWGLISANSSSTVNNLQSTMTTLSATGGNLTFSTSTPSTTQAQLNESVSLGIAKLTSNNNKANFVKAVTVISSQEKAGLKAFGIKANSVKINPMYLTINGKQWIRVDTSYPGQFSTNLYYWDNNQGINLMVSNASQKVENQLTNSFLLPMAASMQLKP